MNGVLLTACIMPFGCCSISATGGPYFLSEMAEQLAWLASALRLSPHDNAIVAILPRIESLSVGNPPSEFPKAAVGSCQLSFEVQNSDKASVHTNGSCWIRLFANPILVSGYPVSRRPIPKAGLEIPLEIMASLVRTNQIVRLGDRIVMKGFNSLLVATTVESSLIMWHALVSSKVDERIFYFDSRIDGLVTMKDILPSLRALESSRHIIGWCSQATDFCGKYCAETSTFT